MGPKVAYIHRRRDKLFPLSGVERWPSRPNLVPIMTELCGCLQSKPLGLTVVQLAISDTELAQGLFADCLSVRPAGVGVALWAPFGSSLDSGCH
jgi:hypothetical protein